MPAIASKARQPDKAWVWFAYTAFLFIDPILSGSRIVWLGTLAVFAIFLPLFWIYVHRDHDCSSSRVWVIFATFALGAVTFPWNGGGSTFFVYAASFLAFSFDSLRRVLQLFVLELFLVLVEGYLLHARTGRLHTSWADTFSSIFFMCVIGGGNLFWAQDQRAERKLRSALEENLTLAAVAERERIARDLHDVLGHTLSVIVLKAELANRLLKRSEDSLTAQSETTDPQRAQAEIADVERIARTALSEVREAIGGYRARGLTAEIESARLTLAAAGVTLMVDSDAPHTALLSATEETALSLVLREAVTNIVRHARASTCHLRLVTEDHHCRLIVEDNGQHPVPREGNGLRGMRMRIESLGGHLLLERDHGTRLLVELPLRTEGAAS